MKKRILIRFKMILVLCLTYSFSWCDEKVILPTFFPYFSKINTPKSTEHTTKQFSFFSIKSDFFEKCDDFETDFRIFELESKQIIPYFLQQNFISKLEKKYVPLQTSTVNVTHENKQELEIIFKISLKGEQKVYEVSRLEIITDSRDFDKKIQLYSSQDLHNWTKICNSTFFDYSSKLDFRSGTIIFQPTKANYFKIIIENYIEKKESNYAKITSGDTNLKEFTENNEHIRINDIILFYQKEELENKSAITQKKCFNNVVVKKDAKNSNLILETQKEPLVNFSITSSTDYYYRNIEIYTSDKKDKDFKYLCNSTIYKSLIDNKGTISFPKTQSKFFKIVIKNNDNEALENIKILGEYLDYQVIFLTPKDKINFSCYFGAKMAKAKFDVEKLIVNQQMLEMEKCDLDEIKNNPEFSEIKIKDFSNFYIVSFILAALVLIILIKKNIEKIEHIKED